MSVSVVRGTPASPGCAVGPVWRWDDELTDERRVPSDRRSAEIAVAHAALDAAAQALRSVAATLTAADQEIVETGALMAQDPALREAVDAAIGQDGLGAGPAILRAGHAFAQAIANLPDSDLAARADDVRSLARRAARIAVGRGGEPPVGREVILVARDVGPADVAETAHALAGVALAAGGVTAHAAIVARSLGIPMVSGLGSAALDVHDGRIVALDGSSGMLTLDPTPELTVAARTDMDARVRGARRSRALRDQPAITTDGVRVTVMANVGSRAELDVAREAGAEGIGLLRTELAFLDAPAWPSEAEHVAALEAILSALHGQPAIVRVLDFGADKAPPFLASVPERGLALLLAHEPAFTAQLRAILRIAKTREVHVMLPMVESVGELEAVHALLGRCAGELAIGSPPVGVMIETEQAVEHVAALAREAAFLSLGTNDLTAAILGVDRFAANPGQAHHPRVLRAIARSVAAADEAGVPIEICGEAASDPAMLPLLVGLGLTQLSVGAARVGQVRDWIRRLDAREASGLARSALTMDSCDEVEWAARPLAAELVGSVT